MITIAHLEHSSGELKNVGIKIGSVIYFLLKKGANHITGSAENSEGRGWGSDSTRTSIQTTTVSKHTLQTNESKAISSIFLNEGDHSAGQDPFIQ